MAPDIQSIMSGSATPACDLEVAVEAGKVTQAEAEAAYRTQFPRLTVAAGAQLERDYQKWLDI